MEVAMKNSNSPINFYFDFISPYGYVAAAKIKEIADRYDRQIEWHPMLLGVSVLKKMGLKPLLETPLKGAYCMKDLPRLAALYDIPLKPAFPMPKPLPAARCLTWVRQNMPIKTEEFALAVYRSYWAEGKNISDYSVLAGIADLIGIDGDRMIADAEGEPVKQALMSAVEDSMKQGVFGSPTFEVDGELIWGCDRLWMLEHWLKYGRWQPLSS
ncbi:2-hydroxychromene-2-carboxylate isomerase [Bacterioplanoides sp.]|uniref:2-hydroxychromene-2-carboxylate isomerase n=1 Tax=Bacterioplanoides sp. TaxID=2066072 RepID=UPI003B598326